MTTGDPTRNSLWMDAPAARGFPQATPCAVDVVIVGAGIAGLSTAYHLKRAGLRVAVVDRTRVAEGNSALTTAHLTWMLDAPVVRLRRDFGPRAAATVLEAHAAAIDEIERVVTVERINCDFERVVAWRCGLSAGDRPALEQDAEAARALGRDCDYVPPEAAPLHAAGGALRVPRQARFHPRRYLLALADRVDGDGSRVFENSPVTETTHTGDTWVVRAGDTVLAGRHLVIATHSPLGLVPSLQARLEPFQTYALAARVPTGSLPEGLYWDCGQPYQYTRIQRGDGFDVVVVGGADHKTGEAGDNPRAHGILAEYLRSVLGVSDCEITHEWSGQVLEPADGVAYIGRHPGESRNRWVATGFGGNGMTYGPLAGMVLRDLVQGTAGPWTEVFDPGRSMALAGAAQVVRSNADVAYQFVARRLARAECDGVNEVPRGEGRMVKVRGRKLAVFRDAAGSLTALSPVCPHMACLVDWNARERTWDCPCHGSRFSATGEVLTGPAKAALHRVALDEEPSHPAQVSR